MANPANGREMAAIDWLGVLCAMMAEHEPGIKARLKNVKNGWRDYRLALTLVSKLLGKAVADLPESQQRHVRNVLKTHEVTLRPAQIVKTPNDMLLIDKDAFRTVINMAMEAECAICIKSDAEIRGCKLRKALETCIILDDYPPYGCGYLNVVTNNNLGDYI